MLYLGNAGLVLLLTAIKHSHVIILICPQRQDPTARHAGRLDREKRAVEEENEIKPKRRRAVTSSPLREV